MPLSADLISQFVKVTKDSPKDKNSSVVYGKVKAVGDRMFVQLDGSPEGTLTPVTTTTDIKVGERVAVSIENHSATVTGNMSSRSAQYNDVQQIQENYVTMEYVNAHKVTTEELDAVSAVITELKAKLATIGKLEALEANIDELFAKYAELKYLSTDEIDAILANIDTLHASFADFENIEALTAEITKLKGYTAEFTYVTTEVLKATKADINQLNVKLVTADNADLKYVNIDFANIDQAWMDEFYANSGLIEFITAGDTTVTGRLVGVTIQGDLIEAGTLVADKLVVRGDDGNYYKLNTDFSAIPGVEPVEEDAIHGSVMVANSITAEKIQVKDLAAFDAKIAGFNITSGDEESGVAGRIYSGAKASVDASNPGIYMDNDGQIHFGDRNNFIKFYKDVDPETGVYILDKDGNPTYKLAIAADTVMFGGNDVADLKTLTDHVKIGKYEGEACVELAEADTDGDGVSDFKQVITSTKTMFINNADVKTQIDHDGVKTDNLVVDEEFRQGNFVWATHGDGNYGLIWKEVGN